jgi:hypothetical protein
MYGNEKDLSLQVRMTRPYRLCSDYNLRCRWQCEKEGALPRTEPKIG